MERLGASIVAVAVLLVAAPAADGARRHVTPDGSATSANCAEAAPCQLRHAIEDVADPNDEILVAPGTYVTGPIRVHLPLEIHGLEGQPRPLITTSDQIFGPLHLVGPTVGTPGAAGSVLRHLRFEFGGDAPFPTLGTSAEVTLEELEVVRTGGGTAVQLGHGALLRDSVVTAAGDSARAVSIAYSGSSHPDGLTAHLRNVTASAAGPGAVGLAAMGNHGAEMMLCQEAQHAVVTLVNAIVRGETDLFLGRSGACPDNEATATVTVGHSNYRPEAVVLDDGAHLVDDGGNQALDPRFADAQNGDFHLRAGSPAIDAGREDALNGSRDIDGTARPQGSAFDIGADEVPPAGAPPGDSNTSPPRPDATPTRQADTTAPALGRPSVRRRFPGSRSCRTGTGRRRPRIVLRFRLSEPALVRVVFVRVRRGRDPVKAGTVRAQGRAGRNAIRIRCRRLRPGRYRARLVAIDAAGNRSQRRGIAFRIRPRRARAAAPAPARPRAAGAGPLP